MLFRSGRTINLDGEVTTIGTAPGSTVVLNDSGVSRKHAGIRRVGTSYELADMGSTNGVYVNGERISGRRAVQLSDVIQIGPFVLQADAAQGVAVYDTRSKTRIDCINITKIVKNRSGGGTIKLLGPAATQAMFVKQGLPMVEAAWILAVVVEVGGGLAMLFGLFTRPVGLVLAIWCVATALIAHSNIADRAQEIQFFKNMGLTGGFLYRRTKRRD